MGENHRGGNKMKLGVFTVLYQNIAFEDMLDKVAEMGIEAVELGTGTYPGTSHCNPDELLGDPGKIKSYLKAIESRGLSISGLSFHGNPLHPNRKFAKESHDAMAKNSIIS